jgi:MerR family transcriptional regulator, repressor of the yfmOP operon
VTAEPAAVEARLRIGEAAARAGVSTRTLRYYQELDLLTPAGTTAGGARRYSEADVARVQRIRHLRDLVGFDRGEVAQVLAAEDRLAAIRHEWFQGQTPRRQRELLEEALSINHQLQGAAQAKMAALLAFRAELEERAAAYRERLAELSGPAAAAEPVARRPELSSAPAS